MKTAISLPDELFAQIDSCAHRLGIPRSRLLALAAQEFLARQEPTSDPTESWNAALAAAGPEQPAEAAFRRRSKEVLGRDPWTP